MYLNTKRFKPNNVVQCTMITTEYMNTLSEIRFVSRFIDFQKSQIDGRIDSAFKEFEFLNEMKRELLYRNPEWNIVISPPRAPYDIMVNSIRINLKLTDCKAPDNCMNKPSIFYSITGNENYPRSSTWNEFLDILVESGVKPQRCRFTEYHYLVKNKLTGNVLLKSIFDIKNYVSNASNILQINWKNEFSHYKYHTLDENYLEKVHSLLKCMQKSVKDMIERSVRFADADISELF
jgi:hypothetical protein